ncbi:MAG: fibronectin type III domain-containing protein, partial [Nocardioides sp.]
DGRLLYRDVLPAVRTASLSAAPAGPFPYDQTFRLHSRPGALRTIYLDFDGQDVSETAWNQGPDRIRSGFYPGMSVDGDPAFTEAEQDIVQDVWQRVAEDYAPFEVDVTTEDPGAAALTRSGTADQVFGMRALVTAENWCGDFCLGIAYTDVFDLVGGAFYQPAWAFSDEVDNDPIQIAESITHEVGHTLGLLHDGVVGGDEYFLGHGMWSPIMGAGFGALTQWSKGEYSGANNKQDDIAVMASRGIPLRADDHGDVAAPTPFVGNASGLIERRTDTDWFTVNQTCPGQLTVEALPAPRGPDLDIRLTVRRAASASDVADPGSFRSDTFTPQGLGATTTNNVSPGIYLIGIDGVGARTPATTGYSDYGSLGAYSVSAATTCTEPVAPAPVTLTSSVTSSSVTVGWQEPLADGGSPITGYVVRLGGGAGVLLPADARSHTFTGVAPATTYTVSVLARTDIGDSPEVSRAIKTPATTPGAARIGTAESGARGGAVTARARWSAPLSTGGSAVTSYRVRASRVSSSGATLSRKTFTAAKDARRLTMRLKAGRYRFEVRAVNAVGAGAWSARSNKVVAR